MTETRRPGAQHLRDPVLFAALGFGSGLAPRAPGTAGTVAGVLIYLAVIPFGDLAHAALTLVAVLAGIPLCGIAARRLGVHDHPAIVWDEIAGFLLAMLLVPVGLPWIVAGFLLFRLFDVWKPWPIGWLDRQIGGGTGIMIDDIVAGLYTLAVLHLAVWLQGQGLW